MALLSRLWPRIVQPLRQSARTGTQCVYAWPQSTHRLPCEQWQAVIQTNVNAVFMLNHGLFELLDSSDHGFLIHVSLTVGQQGRAYWGAYSTSKFALEGLSQILADETETAGKIRVYSINPGGTRTGMRREAYPLEDQRLCRRQSNT